MFIKHIYHHVERYLRWALPLLDFISVILAAHMAAYFLSPVADISSVHYQLAIFFLALLTPFWLSRSMLYQPWRGQPVSSEIRQLLLAILSLGAVCAIVALATKTGAMFSRRWMATWFLLVISLLVGSRFVLRFVLVLIRSRGGNSRHILMVGNAESCEGIRRRLLANPGAGFTVDQQIELDLASEAGIDNSVNQIIRQLRTKLPDQLWLAIPIQHADVIGRIRMQAIAFPISVIWVPDPNGVLYLNHRILEVARMPVVDLGNRYILGFSSAAKRIFDLVIALPLLVLLAPFLLVVAAAIKLESGGSVFYKQVRHGWLEKPITIYKFRTMQSSVSSEKGPVVSATRNDGRVTKLGKLLRRTSVDELPQLINVIQGRMSLVGPRPHSVDQHGLFTNYASAYPVRHKVLPGITGWAQVNGFRGEIENAEMLSRRVEHDLYYINNWSMWFDFRILVITVFRGWTGPKAY